jgi:hypothetical protein
MLASGHLANYLLLLLKGLAITLELSLGSLVLGSLGGIVLGAMRSSRWRALKAMALILKQHGWRAPRLLLFPGPTERQAARRCATWPAGAALFTDYLPEG